MDKVMIIDRVYYGEMTTPLLDLSCMATIAVGILYDQIVRDIKIKYGCISFKHKAVYHMCLFEIYYKEHALI